MGEGWNWERHRAMEILEAVEKGLIDDGVGKELNWKLLAYRVHISLLVW